MTSEIAYVLIGFVAGSVPFAYLAARLAGRDIRREGSGNVGATNVWRVLGPRYGFPTFLLDALKGYLPALLALHAHGPTVAVLAGAAAILGHTFTPFMRFRGGKGVATASGVAAALTPIVWIVLVLTFLAVLWLTRYVSVASVTIAAGYPILLAITQAEKVYVVFAAAVAVAVIGRHRGNLARLRAGTERRTERFGRGASRA